VSVMREFPFTLRGVRAAYAFLRDHSDLGALRRWYGVAWLLIAAARPNRAGGIGFHALPWWAERVALVTVWCMDLRERWRR